MSYGILPIEDIKSCGVSADQSAEQNGADVPSDLISREAAIEAVAQQWLFEASAESPYVNDDDIGEYRKTAEELFADVPSAEPAPVVAYICDRRRCAICNGPDGGCDHTTDIKHAAHFKNVAGQYFERPYMEEEKDDE